VSVISIVEFYSWLGVNPYVYIGIFVASGLVFLVIAVTVQSFFTKRLYDRMDGTGTKDVISLKATITEIGVPKRREASVVFTDEGGLNYIFGLPRIQATFLSEGEEGELKFKGSKFISFLPLEEEDATEENEGEDSI